LGTPGAAGLNFDPVSASSLPVFLGAQFETEFAMKDGSVMVPYVRLAWMHDFTPSRSINAGFVAAPGYSFTVLGASQQRDALVVRSGAQLKITELLRLFGSFDGIFGPRGTSLAGTAGIQMAW
jgi:outer membrane autotransporter protein